MELTRPFAENGDRKDFPVDTQGDGTMSLQQGFGAFYGLPPEEGGLFIQRPQFNQLMYLTTKGVIDNKTAIEALESEYSSLSISSPKLLTKNLTWTVGSGGDYKNLTDALKEACKYVNILNFNITITIKTGYDFANDNIIISGVDLSFVIINFESQLVCNNSSYCLTFNYCKAPYFKLNLNTLSNTKPIIRFNQSSCYCEINGSYNLIFEVDYGSNVIVNSGSINFTNKNNSYISLSAIRGSLVLFKDRVLISGNISSGYLFGAESGSRILKNGGGNVNLQITRDGGFLTAMSSYFDGFNGTINSTSSSPVYKLSRGSIGYDYSTITGTAPKYNIAVNTVTSNGIIMK
ncbi:hypothetical protein VSW09_001676 [Campylobacter jejuni]|nr:hypothetical protein [Campylobacter jejuni]